MSNDLVILCAPFGDHGAAKEEAKINELYKSLTGRNTPLACRTQAIRATEGGRNFKLCPKAHQGNSAASFFLGYMGPSYGDKFDSKRN